MTHKNRIAIIVSGAVMYALATLGHAAEPAAKTVATPDNAAIARQLGVIDGILSYCGAVDPAASEKLRKKIGELTAGLSAPQLEKLRASEDYQQGATSIEQFTAKVDEHNAKRLCSESTAAGQ